LENKEQVAFQTTASVLCPLLQQASIHELIQLEKDCITWHLIHIAFALPRRLTKKRLLMMMMTNLGSQRRCMTLWIAAICCVSGVEGFLQHHQQQKVAAVPSKLVAFVSSTHQQQEQDSTMSAYDRAMAQMVASQQQQTASTWNPGPPPPANHDGKEPWHPGPPPSQPQQLQQQRQQNGGYAPPESTADFPGSAESDGIVGDKYVLGTDPMTSSGKSAIYEAIPHDVNSGQPLQGPVIVKLSSNTEALQRERDNYERIVQASTAAQEEGLFVQVHEYLEEADPNNDHELQGQAALIMEKGEQDLQTYIQQHGPLKGKQLQDAMRSVAKCVEAVHASKMVWTEIKGANFVITSSENNHDSHTIGAASQDNSATLNIKGIDLESAVPKQENPIDFSAEAIPPCFALDFLCGREPNAKMEKSFDIWSTGILFYKLATGKAYFNKDKKDSFQIAMALKNAAMEQGGQGSLDLNKHGDIDEIVDAEELKDLIQSCLRIDPAERPTIGEVLQHPFFSLQYDS
jgi:serine/threonine protein kinase